MRRLFLRFMTCWYLLCIATVALGAVDVKAGVSRSVVYEGETIEYFIEISGEAGRFPDLALSNLDGFQVYASGTNQNVQWVNGRFSQSMRYNFRLVPTRSGSITIPAMIVEVEGKKHQTEPITVKVNAGTPPQARSTDPRRTQRQPQSEIRENDLFIETVVDKDTVYVNEQITLTFKFYQAIAPIENLDYTPPQKTGFWVEEMPPQRSYYQTVRGREYKVTEIKTALFPTAPGAQTIGSATLTAVVRERVPRDPFSIFDNSFSSLFGRTVPITLKSDTIGIVTLPLPSEGRPDNYTGAVGRFKISATVDKQTAEVNEPITMTVRISGVGNVKSISAPRIPEMPDFRTYQAGDSEGIERIDYQLGGYRSFEQVFIPRRAGTFTLPSIAFVFFDPGTKRYETVTSDPIRVEVSPSHDRFVSQLQSIQSNRLDLTAKDIRYLKPSPGSLYAKRSAPIVMSPIALGFYLLPFLGYLGVVQFQKRRDKLASDEGLRRLKQARKMAEKRLSRARSQLGENQPDQFYLEVSRALIDYFADRYNLPAFGLTADKIREYGSGKENDQHIVRMLDLLEQCDFGRFAPGGAESGQKERLLSDAGSLIVEMERNR